MKKHRPNFIPLKTRVFLAVCALFLLAFVLAELAIGYTYLPGRRGGFLLSGIPTLMIAISAATLLLAAVLTIVDHYDRRPNEESYKAVKLVCFKISFYLFVAAPFVELFESLLSLGGINPFPKFHGIAEQYSFYSPELKVYAHYLAPIKNSESSILILSILLLGVGFFVEKFFAGRAKQFVVLVAAIGMLGLSSVWLTSTTSDLLRGEVTAGRRASKRVVHAENEPAKFNAILLTHFSLGGLMFISSAVVILGVITNRIRLT